MSARRGLLLSLAAAAALWAAGPARAADAIGAADLATRVREGAAPLVLDVRTREEFASGHIPGAVNIPHTELRERLGELRASKDEEIVVHCERGGRAEAAEAVLREAGFAQVLDLSGHMQAWRAAGLPLEPAPR
jgi:rhodanese-related sulfurtransferase